MFDHLVDLTEPVCHCIDTQKASMLLFDTSAIEAWVTYITCFVFHACRNHFNDIPQLQPHIAFYLFPIKPCASCTIPYLAFFTIITSHMPQIWFRTCFSQYSLFHFSTSYFATVYKGNIIKNLIMDCQSYTKYRPNETTGGIFVSWRRKEELPTGA